MSSNLAIAITVGATVGGAIAGIKNLRSVVGLLKNDSISASKKLTVLGSGTAVAAAAAVNSIKAVSSIVMSLSEEAIKFESAMADVKKVVDFESPQGLANLKKDILDLTRTIPMAKEELAAIAASGGQLGVAEKDLKSFTTTIAKMAVAFDMSADLAGDSMAKLANVYKIPIGQIDKLGDAINHLSNKSPAKASDIVNTLGRVGGVAEQFGLTELQTASLSNAFISLSKTPEVAGTAINGMLTKLMTADKQGKKFQAVLQGMGTDSKALKKAIKENGEQALMSFLKQIEKLPKESQMGALVDLFGLEYADDVAALVGGSDTYQKSINELQKAGKGGKLEFIGSMEKEFAARSATTENGLALMKNSWAEFMTVIGDRLLPIINQVSSAMAGLIHSVTDWAAGNPAVIDSIIQFGGVLAGLVVGITTFTALMGVGSMGFVILSKAISGVGTFIGYVTRLVSFFGRGLLFIIRLLPMLGSAFMKLGAFLMANPIFAAIGLLTLAGYLLYDNWEAVVSGAKILWQDLGTFFTVLWKNVTTAFRAAWNGILTWLSAVWEIIKGFCSAGILALVHLILSFSPAALFMRVFQALWRWLAGLGATFYAYGGQMINGLVNGIKAGVGRAVEAVRSVVSAVKSAFTSDTKGMGIHSPSRVFRSYGGYMTQGLAIGVNKNADLPIQAVGAWAGRLKERFADRMGQLRSDIAARVSAGRATFAAERERQAVAAGNGGMVINYNPTINAPGGDMQQIQTALALSQREFEAMFKRMMADRARRAY